MEIQSLKEYILNNDLIEDLLKEIGCHSIRRHGEYVTCGNKDGDNKSAIVLYLNENLTVVNYTRQIAKNKRATDIFDLICYNEECTFPESLKFACNLFGLDFYQEPEDIPESLQILQLLRDMASGNEKENDVPLRTIPEEILNYYLPYSNKMFEDDGISLEIQREFGIGYDPSSNRITIPIRSAIGDLCGVKGRLFGKPDEYNPKYLYNEKCSKSHILYGYFENINYIKNSSNIFVVESEKAVMQAASAGYRNVVSTGGKTISKTQVEMLTRLGCKIVFAYDADVNKEELYDIASMFIDGVSVFAIIDEDGILLEKQSPTDDMNKFKYMINNNVIQLK